MKIFLKILLLLLFAFCDKEKVNESFVIRSLDGRRYLVARPESVFGTNGVTSVFKSNDELVCSMKWYSRSIYHSPDFEYVVRCGPWAENFNDLAYGFYSNGALLKEYLVSDFISNFSNVERSVSHFNWRSPKPGIPTDIYETNGLFITTSMEKMCFYFNISNGQLITKKIDTNSMTGCELIKYESDKNLILLSGLPAFQKVSQLFEISEVWNYSGTRFEFLAKRKPNHFFRYEVTLKNPFKEQLFDWCVFLNAVKIVEKHPVSIKLFNELGNLTNVFLNFDMHINALKSGIGVEISDVTVVCGKGWVAQIRIRPQGSTVGAFFSISDFNTNYAISLRNEKLMKLTNNSFFQW